MYLYSQLHVATCMWIHIHRGYPTQITRFTSMQLHMYTDGSYTITYLHYMHSRKYADMCIHAYTKHMYVRLYIHTYVCTQTHTHTHTHTHTYTYTHMHAWEPTQRTDTGMYVCIQLHLYISNTKYPQPMHYMQLATCIRSHNVYYLNLKLLASYWPLVTK